MSEYKFRRGSNVAIDKAGLICSVMTSSIYSVIFHVIFKKLYSFQIASFFFRVCFKLIFFQNYIYGCSISNQLYGIAVSRLAFKK